MAEQNGRKLNRLEHLLPEGLLADSAWMSQHGYSTSLRSQYVAAGWLQHPFRQVYRRSRAPLTWQQAVVSLQTFLGNDLVVGGRSALQLQGFAHYIPLSQTMREVFLYGPTPPNGYTSSSPSPPSSIETATGCFATRRASRTSARQSHSPRNSGFPKPQRANSLPSNGKADRSSIRAWNAQSLSFWMNCRRAGPSMRLIWRWKA